MFEETAKPTPWLPPLEVAICELTPITRPLASSSGPPELPGLMAASVWITSSIWKPLGAWISRPVPETMPEVAVRSSPNGWPIAITVSPTCTLSESASVSGRSGPDSSGSTCSTARSRGRVGAEHSAPSTWRPLSLKRTRAVPFSPTTWLLVTIVPSRGDHEAGAGGAAGLDRDDAGAGGLVDAADRALRQRLAAADERGGELLRWRSRRRRSARRRRRRARPARSAARASGSSANRRRRGSATGAGASSSTGGRARAAWARQRACENGPCSASSTRCRSTQRLRRSLMAATVEGAVSSRWITTRRDRVFGHGAA